MISISPPPLSSAYVVSASAQLIPGPGGNIVDSRVSTFPGKKPKKVCTTSAFVIMVKLKALASGYISRV